MVNKLWLVTIIILWLRENIKQSNLLNLASFTKCLIFLWKQTTSKHFNLQLFVDSFWNNWVCFRCIKGIFHSRMHNKNWHIVLPAGKRNSKENRKINQHWLLWSSNSELSNEPSFSCNTVQNLHHIHQICSSLNSHMVVLTPGPITLQCLVGQVSKASFQVQITI